MNQIPPKPEKTYLLYVMLLSTVSFPEGVAHVVKKIYFCLSPDRSTIFVLRISISDQSLNSVDNMIKNKCIVLN